MRYEMMRYVASLLVLLSLPISKVPFTWCVERGINSPFTAARRTIICHSLKPLSRSLEKILKGNMPLLWKKKKSFAATMGRKVITRGAGRQAGRQAHVVRMIGDPDGGGTILSSRGGSTAISAARSGPWTGLIALALSERRQWRGWEPTNGGDSRGLCVCCLPGCA